MAYEIYRPENGPFPPRFGQTRLALQKTEVPGGNGAACLGEYLYLVNRAIEGGCLSILKAEGDVVLADISDLTAPRLLKRLHFSGHPDLACVVENSVYIPLGHQGIAKITI